MTIIGISYRTSVRNLPLPSVGESVVVADTAEGERRATVVDVRDLGVGVWEVTTQEVPGDSLAAMEGSFVQTWEPDYRAPAASGSAVDDLLAMGRMLGGA